ncbi:MAG: pilin [Lautropia sp.]|nr:pilin [Lautropia sp.]
MRRGQGQQGFTVVDLMIGAAMLGIVAAVAIPVYQDYTVRVQVTEGLTLAAGAQAHVASMAAAGLPAGQVLAQGYATGYGGQAPTRQVQSIEITPESGVVSVVYPPRLAPIGQNRLVLQPVVGQAGLPVASRPFAPVTEPIVWHCRAAGARLPAAVSVADAPKGTLQPRFAPAECR